MTEQARPVVAGFSYARPPLEAWKAQARTAIPMRNEEAVLWLLGHYPNTPETDERVAKALALHRELGLPIWLFGSRMACFPETTEQLMKDQLLKQGVRPEAIICSADIAGSSESLDTVQEAFNVAAAARREGVQTLVCVSNRLHLWQVKALLRQEPLTFVYVPTPLREWRWWYILARLLLIPLAFAGIGKQFVALNFLRRARAAWAWWPL